MNTDKIFDANFANHRELNFICVNSHNSRHGFFLIRVHLCSSVV